LGFDNNRDSTNKTSQLYH